MAKLIAEKRIELVHVSLMRTPMFQAFVGLFMVGKTEVCDKTRTASTNGRDARYGRAFIDILSDKELAFIVMHENMHKAYRHMTTWKALYDIDSGLANEACDHVINLQLVALDPNETVIAFPRDPITHKRMGMYDEQFNGMDTKQVFDILRKERDGGNGGCKGPEGKPGGNGHQDGGQAGGQDRQPVDGSTGHGGFDEHDWEDAKAMSDEEKKALEGEIEQALRQGGIYAGKMGANVPREISDLLKPRVNWREVLRRFTKTYLKDRQSPSWRKAHRNYLWQDVILPSIIGKRMKHLVIGIDTSGSIQGAILTAFMSELNLVVTDSNPDRIDIVYWDARVAGHETYKGSDSKSIVHKTNPKGGGGTNPDVVATYMIERKLNPDALIMLSDGCMHSTSENWVGITCPSLWCIIGNENYVAPHGQRVVVKE